MAESVVALHKGHKVALEAAAETFLSQRDLADSTKAVYRRTLDRLADDLGADTPVQDIDGQQLVDHMAATYTDEDGEPTVAAATYNRHVATISSLMSGSSS